MARIMLRELLKGDTQAERVGINVVNENYTTVKGTGSVFAQLG